MKRKAKPISQAEARRLQQRVRDLEYRLRDLAHTNPDGICLATVGLDGSDSPCYVAVRTAKALGHGVSVRLEGNGKLQFVAVPKV